MEEDNIVKSMVIALYGERQTNKEGKGYKPKGAYKEVLRPSQRLALPAAKRSLTTTI